VLVYLHPDNLLCFCRLDAHTQKHDFVAESPCLRFDLLSLLLQYVTMFAPAGCAVNMLKETANAEKQWVQAQGTGLSLDDLVRKAISRDCTCPISQVSHTKTATELLYNLFDTSCLQRPSLDPTSFFTGAMTHLIR
jgi:hypothetical protein